MLGVAHVAQRSRQHSQGTIGEHDAVSIVERAHPRARSTDVSSYHSADRPVGGSDGHAAIDRAQSYGANAAFERLRALSRESSSGV